MPGSMEETSLRFFKIILASTIEDKKLSIPKQFVGNFGDELSTVATLTVPDGYSWQVGISKDEGKIWFDSAWHEFVKHYSICVGYFIVFRYLKNSNFQVHIFDTSTCEIRYQCRKLCTPSKSSPYLRGSNMSRKRTATLGSSKFKNVCGSRLEEVEVKDELDDVSDSMQCKLSKIKKSNSQGSVRLKMHLSETNCLLDQETDLFVDCTKVKNSKHNVKNEQQADAVGTNEVIALLKDLRIFICNSPKSLSRRERQRAINVAQFVKPKRPSFLVIMRHSFILKSSVYVPAAFSHKYLSRDKLLIVKDSHGTELNVSMSWTSECYLSGWSGYFKDNDVKEGDILFFELIKMKDLLLKVSVFPAKVSI